MNDVRGIMVNPYSNNSITVDSFKIGDRFKFENGSTILVTNMEYIGNDIIVSTIDDKGHHSSGNIGTFIRLQMVKIERK